jgi:hypothetical protein
MIRADAIWLATEPMDMRAGTETALARVVAVNVLTRLPTQRASEIEKLLLHKWAPA